jgi:hypothetical protein
VTEAATSRRERAAGAPALAAPSLWYERLAGLAWRGIVIALALALLGTTFVALGALVLGVPNVGAIFMITFPGGYVPYIGATLSGMVAVIAGFLGVRLAVPVTGAGVVARCELRVAGHLGRTGDAAG